MKRTHFALFSGHASVPVAMLALVLTLGFSSCAPKKAVVVEAAPQVTAPKVDAPVVPPLPTSGEPNDRLRGIDEMMLSLPTDNDFQATVPVPSANPSGANAVISRPPTDPPPRPKPPKEGE
jgi:hypothetical protein